MGQKKQTRSKHTIADHGVLNGSTERAQTVGEEPSKGVTSPQIRLDSGLDSIHLPLIEVPQMASRIKNMTWGCQYAFPRKGISGLTHALSMLLN